VPGAGSEVGVGSLYETTRRFPILEKIRRPVREFAEIEDHRGRGRAGGDPFPEMGGEIQARKICEGKWTNGASAFTCTRREPALRDIFLSVCASAYVIVHYVNA